jgi:hypothetical protein
MSCQDSARRFATTPRDFPGTSDYACTFESGKTDRLRQILTAQHTKVKRSAGRGNRTNFLVSTDMSSRDSPLQKCNFVLRHWSPLQHDTALPSSNSSRVSARFVPLRLSAGQIPSAHLFNRALCALSSGSQLITLSCSVLRSAAQSPRTSRPLLPTIEFPSGPRLPQPRAASF